MILAVLTGTVGYRTYLSNKPPVIEGFSRLSPDRNYKMEGYKIVFFDFLKGKQLTYALSVSERQSGKKLQHLIIQRPDLTELPNFKIPRGQYIGGTWTEDSETATWWFNGIEISLYPRRKEAVHREKRPLESGNKIFEGILDKHPSDPKMWRLSVAGGKGYLDVSGDWLEKIVTHSAVTIGGNLVFRLNQTQVAADQPLEWNAVLEANSIAPLSKAKQGIFK